MWKWGIAKGDSTIEISNVAAGLLSKRSILCASRGLGCLGGGEEGKLIETYVQDSSPSLRARGYADMGPGESSLLPSAGC